MKIQTVSIAALNPASYNPRTDLQPGDPAYDALKRSINTFGLVEPIIWNKQTGNVVGGHQRLKVLLENGITEVECVVVDLDDANEKALNLALNKIEGKWDDAMLRDLLADISGVIDATLTGFSDDELERILEAGDVDAYGDDFTLPDGEKPGIEHMSFSLATEQAAVVKAALQEARQNLDERDSFGNENENGNALYRMV